ncbi:MAG: hypothetical protein FWE10_01270 [Rikenellaceae bacterium]|nr:hypothetical protein [Rikenellaceae bacterium]MCL2692636.1 hypothetical protein [Rikenellaceae bacterium]
MKKTFVKSALVCAMMFACVAVSAQNREQRQRPQQPPQRPGVERPQQHPQQQHPAAPEQQIFHLPQQQTPQEYAIQESNYWQTELRLNEVQRKKTYDTYLYKAQNQSNNPSNNNRVENRVTRQMRSTLTPQQFQTWQRMKSDRPAYNKPILPVRPPVPVTPY